MVATANDRLKKAFEALKDTYDQIEEKTGISRSTLIRMTKPGASIKLDLIDTISSVYDTFDGDYVKTGKEPVPTSGRFGVPTWGRSGSVPPVAHDNRAHVGTDEVNEEQEKFEAFTKIHRKGTAGSKLKPEDWDNPMVILNAAVTDLRREWEGPVRNLKKEERMQWLREALQVIRDIASKNLDRLDEQE